MALSGFFRSFNCASSSSSYPKKRKANKMNRNTSNLSTNGKKPSAPIDSTTQHETVSNSSDDNDIVSDQTFYDIGSYKSIFNFKNLF